MKKITLEQLGEEAHAFVSKAEKVAKVGFADDPWVLYIRYWWSSHEHMRHRADVVRICLELEALAKANSSLARTLAFEMDQELFRHLNAQKEYKRGCDAIRSVYPILSAEFDRADESAASWLVIRPEAEAVEP